MCAKTKRAGAAPALSGSQWRSGGSGPAAGGSGEFADARLDMLQRDRGDAQAHETRGLFAAIEEPVAGFDDDAARSGRFRQATGISAARPFQPERGAARRVGRAPFWQESGNRMDQTLAPLVEGGGEPAHQRLVVAERQEQRHRALVVRRRVPQHEATQRAKLGDQSRRGHDVAEPQAWSERLRHRADIDDAAGAVEALQRLLRRLVEQLAVIAILDDDLVVAVGARQKVLPPLRRQGHHGRAVVAGRDEDEAGIARDRRSHDARLIDRNRLDIGAGQPEDRAGVGIAGVLHRHFRTLGHQQRSEHVERVLRAQRHDDLVRIGEDAAARQEPGLDLLDQQRIVAIHHVGRPVADLQHRQRHAVALAPFGGWKQRRIELAVDERIGGLDPVVVLGRRRHVACGDLPARLPVDLILLVRRLLVWLGGGGQHVRVDEMAAPLARHQETLVDQLLEGEHHCAAGNPKFFRENSARRQRHRGGDLSVENGRDDRLADLRLEGLAGFSRNPEQTGPYGRVIALWHGKSSSDGQLFSLGWTSGVYGWHKGLRQSIFLIAGIYASDLSRRDAKHRRPRRAASSPAM
ncbi:hypothetical protein MPL3356_220181 [Mesorhizobium plurifarium]|uniref:Uncharacterized protein n=1 Tax=Mesorhizobium plurifarium TaxID=69974 RepID=A0A090FC86_MESPL|nr:hypothetical protein MPL3356_220181 [Mesorhizobium plurifarium]